MKTMVPTSILFSTKTLAELRKRSAKEMLRTGRTATVSGFIREIVEDALFGTKKEEPEAAAAPVS